MADEQKKITIPEGYIEKAVAEGISADEARGHIERSISVACKSVISYVTEIVKSIDDKSDIIPQLEELQYEKSGSIRGETGEACILFSLNKVSSDYQFKFDLPNDPALIRGVLEMAGGILMCGVTFWKFICQTRPELLTSLRELDADVIWDKLDVDPYKKVLSFARKSGADNFQSKVGLLAAWTDKQGRLMIVKDSKKRFIKK